MLNLGLSTSDLQLYLAGLCQSHPIQVQVQILDLDHHVLADISHMLTDGQVDVDYTADTATRSISMTLFDPQRILSFDTTSPADSAMFMDRMVRITYKVISYESLNRWVSCPVFTGPISGISRDGSTITVQASGKEVMARRPAWRTTTYKAGSTRASVIKSLLADVGETRFDIADDSTKITKNYSVTSETDVWTLAKSLAGGWFLGYDGRGYLCYRPMLSRTVYTFQGGQGGSLVSAPQIAYSVDNMHNCVRVKGAIPKGAKSPVEYTAYPAASHPLSPESLQRNGFPWYIPDIIEDDNLLTVQACKERAVAQLPQDLLTAVSATFDSLVIPSMEEHDVVAVKTDDASWSFHLDTFTIPFTSGGTMTNGYNAERSVDKSKINLHRLAR